MTAEPVLSKFFVKIIQHVLFVFMMDIFASFTIELQQSTKKTKN